MMKIKDQLTKVNPDTISSLILNLDRKLTKMGLTDDAKIFVCLGMIDALCDRSEIDKSSVVRLFLKVNANE